jgi:ADP-ribosylation factor 1/2
VRILLVGLDGAGKTTTLFRLKSGDVLPTVPTIGFNVETIKHNEQFFTLWDVGGQDKIRPLWRHYYQSTQGIMFVVDSTDVDRMDEAKQVLQSMINEDDLLHTVLMVMANKQDAKGAMDGPAVAEALDLNTVQSRPCSIIESSATEGTGLEDALDWLSQAIKEQAKRKKAVATS